MPRATAPASLRLVKGRSEGRDSGGRKVTPPPTFQRVAPKPPTWLSAEAAREWRRVAPGLTRLDLLKPEDRASLATYCETWAMFVLAQRDVARNGLTLVQTTTTREGATIEKPVANPAVAIARAASRDLRAWAGQFGLSPAAESNVKGAAEDDRGEPDPFG